MPDFDKYLNRAYDRAKSDPYMAYAKNQIAQVAKPLERMQQQSQQSMSRAGMSAGSQVAGVQQIQSTQYGEIDRISQEAQQKALENRRLEEQNIDNIKMQKEEWNEQQEDKKNNWIGTAIGATGAVAGGIIGGVATGGTPMGIMAGASIGGGIGTMGGSLVSKSPEQMASGVALTASSIADVVGVKGKRTAMDSFSENIDNLSYNELGMLRTMGANGDYQSMNRFFETYKPAPGILPPVGIGAGLGRGE